MSREAARSPTSDLRRAVLEHPDVLALDDGVRRLSYGELGEAVEGLAGALKGHLPAGARVGVLTARDANGTVAFHAAMAAGLVAVPLPSGGPPDRARAMLDDCGAGLVIVDAAHRRHAEALERAVLNVDARRSVMRESVDETALAYLLYTSGSTGQPKGVAWDHRGAVSFPRWAASRLSLEVGDRIAAVAPLGFDLSTFDLFAALGAGATVLFPPREALLFPRSLADWIAERRPTVIYAVPTLYRQLLDAGADLSSLRAALFAGEVFPMPDLTRLRACLPDAVLENFYGPTETNVCMAHRVGKVEPGDPPLPIGEVLPHFTVVSPDGDARGELVLEGEVMRGYWGALGETRRHATGDLVSRGPGGFRFHGRQDRMVKVRGHRVELGEVEHALASHPDVQEVSVVLREGALYAVYVADPDPGARGLRVHASRRLPAYMHPSAFSRVPQLPRTSTGKVAISELA
ncbi:MAG: amino acid adenylation domain-containing protein [Sandaracinaceae bacterium]